MTRVSRLWWGWMESNHLPSGYEPPALTDELQPRFDQYTPVVSVGLGSENGIMYGVSHKPNIYAEFFAS